MTVVTNPARPDSEDENNGYSGINRLDERVIWTPPDPLPVIRPAEFPPGPNTDQDQQPPSNPSEWYEDDRRCDIVFVAGINGDTARFPGYRSILAKTSPVFKALLADDKTNVIIVDYIDRRGFEQLMRYQYGDHTHLNSVTITKLTLEAGHQFLLPGLVERCAKRLDEMLDSGIALDILRDLRYMCARLPGAASAPPMSAFANDEAAQYLAQCSQWCDSLAHNALLVIDENADSALHDERLEELTYEDLGLIVRRDTLRVSNEMILIEALNRWATAHCKRHMKELTSDNKRCALGELSYCPRYLLLEGEELDRALGLELLEAVERKLVIARARKLSAPIPVGAAQEELLRRWAQPRPKEPVELPVHLSPRSKPAPETPQRSGLCMRRPKRLKQPSFEPDEKEKDGCCACFGDGLLKALICLFD